MATNKKNLWNTKGLQNPANAGPSQPQPKTVNTPPQGFAMNAAGPMPMQYEEKKKKIMFLTQEWLIFFEWVIGKEDDKKLYAAHYCAGSEEFQKIHKQVVGEKLPWFHKAVNTDDHDKCEACEKDIPKELLMACKINNVKI